MPSPSTRLDSRRQRRRARRLNRRRVRRARLRTASRALAPTRVCCCGSFRRPTLHLPPLEIITRPRRRPPRTATTPKSSPRSPTSRYRCCSRSRPRRCTRTRSPACTLAGACCSRVASWASSRCGRGRRGHRSCEGFLAAPTQRSLLSLTHSRISLAFTHSRISLTLALSQTPCVFFSCPLALARALSRSCSRSHAPCPEGEGPRLPLAALSLAGRIGGIHMGRRVQSRLGGQKTSPTEWQKRDDSHFRRGGHERRRIIDVQFLTSGVSQGARGDASKALHRNFGRALHRNFARALHPKFCRLAAEENSPRAYSHILPVSLTLFVSLSLALVRDRTCSVGHCAPFLQEQRPVSSIRLFYYRQIPIYSSCGAGARCRPLQLQVLQLQVLQLLVLQLQELQLQVLRLQVLQ
mmetsp:Transcript_27395/g.60144  ORF Transcript_27395/g.60144 Transcript_27395/m.60144 type:complete len:409 (+) Transcript_27395:183-1409(+)